MAEKRKDASFEEIVQRLEAIAKALESGDTKLEDAVALFEEGVALSKVGKARLDEAEKKLEILKEGDATEPFAADKADREP
ncbi:MAG: exodeoxyribonuclease VII small subunit [Deltaproteobacteria bacterium]|nr:exodeoxyribonuclease VII small subunit [Deltaproteobacteria bacterium]